MIIIYVVSLPFKFRTKTSTEHVPFCTPNMVMGENTIQRKRAARGGGGGGGGKTQSSGKALFFEFGNSATLQI